MQKLITLTIFCGSLFVLWTSCDKDAVTPPSTTTTYNGVDYNNSNGVSSDGTSLFDFRDSNVYSIVQINNQCWMSENLNYNTTGSWYNPSNPSSVYGRLYDWTTVMNGASASSSKPSGVQGICPNGWHLPSDQEWNELEMALGMAASDTAQTGYRGSHAESMKSTTDWASGLNGTNSSGFNAFPTGLYEPNDSLFYNFSSITYFWSTTENINDNLKAYFRYLVIQYTGVYRGPVDKTGGYSCRCLKD